MRYTLCDPPPTGAWTPEEWKAFWQKALDQQNPIPPGYIPPEEITVAKRLYRIGWKPAELARALGVEAATLTLYLKDRKAAVKQPACKICGQPTWAKSLICARESCRAEYDKNRGGDRNKWKPHKFKRRKKRRKHIGRHRNPGPKTRNTRRTPCRPAYIAERERKKAAELLGNIANRRVSNGAGRTA